MSSVSSAATGHDAVAPTVAPQRQRMGSLLIRVSTLLLALLVLVGPGSLAHKHQFGFRVAHAKDDLGAGFGEMRTDGAGGGLFFESGQPFRLGPLRDLDWIADCGFRMGGRRNRRWLGCTPNLADAGGASQG